jgi:hypothetical protein
VPTAAQIATAFEHALTTNACQKLGAAWRPARGQFTPRARFPPTHLSSRVVLHLPLGSIMLVIGG